MKKKSNSKKAVCKSISIAKCHLYTFALLSIFSVSCGQGSNQSNISSHEGAYEFVQISPSEKALDLELAQAIADGTKSTATKLTILGKDIINVINYVSPDFIASLRGLLPLTSVKSVTVNDDHKFMTLNLEKNEIFEVDNHEIEVGDKVDVIGISDSKSLVDFKTIKVSGIRFNGEEVVELLPLENLRVVVVTSNNASEIDLTESTLADSIGSELGNMKAPKNHLYIKSIFQLFSKLQTTPGNVLHILAKKKDTDTNFVPNHDNVLRKSLRDLLVSINLHEDYMNIFDSITDVTIDKTGLKVWLSEVNKLTFGEGSVGIKNFVHFNLGRSFSLKPISGVKVTPNDRKAVAKLDYIRFIDYKKFGRIRAQVTGSKNVFLLGRQSRSYTYDYDIK